MSTVFVQVAPPKVLPNARAWVRVSAVVRAVTNLDGEVDLYGYDGGRLGTAKESDWVEAIER